MIFSASIVLFLQLITYMILKASHSL